MSERAKSFSTYQEQIVSDEELLDFAEINYNQIASATLPVLIDWTVSFCQDLWGMKYFKYQREFVERIVYSLLVDDGDTIAAEFSRQGGKSSALGSAVPGISIILPILAEKAAGQNLTVDKFNNGFWCGVYGPDYDRAAIIGNKLNTTLSSKLAKRILSRPEIGMVFPERISRYTGNLPRNSFINVKSANKRVSIEGNTYHLCITDETQEISDYVLKKSMSPFLAATNGTMVHIGSAYPKKVYFYDICRQLSKNDIDKVKKKKCYFRADYKTCQLYNPNYKKYIKKEKMKLGETSDEFRMSYELYWPIERGMFITEDLLLGMLAKNSIEPGKGGMVTNWDKRNIHAIGIDVGKIMDSTVITVLDVDYKNPIMIDPESNLMRHNKHIKNWLEIQGDDYDSQFYQVVDFIDNFRWQILVIDATGVGQAMYDRLRNHYSGKGNKRVVGFVYSKVSKSDGFSLLYKELLAGRITFPNNPNAQKLRKQQRFIQQMTNVSKEFVNGFLTIETIEETGHDDYPNSLMLANLAAEEEVEAQVVEDIVGANIFKMQNNTKGTNFWQSENKEVEYEYGH